MSISYPVLPETSFNCEKSGRETFLPDAGQRSRTTTPGDDPGDQQPAEWRGFNPDPHAIAVNARLAKRTRDRRRGQSSYLCADVVE
jgi:hypothetical protein